MPIEENNFADARKALMLGIDRGMQTASQIVVNAAVASIQRRGFTKAQLKKARKGRAELDREMSAGGVSGVLGYIGRNKATGQLKTRTGRGERIRLALRLGRTGFHSRPGEPPRFQTGFLAASIKNQQDTNGDWLVGSTMDPKTGYAAALEYGSPKLGLAPRPYIRPAFMATKRQQAEAFFNEIRKAAERYAK